MTETRYEVIVRNVHWATIDLGGEFANREEIEEEALLAYRQNNFIDNGEFLSVNQIKTYEV